MLVPRFTPLAFGFKLLLANFLAGGTNERPLVEPLVLNYFNSELLTGVVAGVGEVSDHYVKPSGFAFVLVAPGAPVLPLAGLLAGSLLPHVIRVVETPRVGAVIL